MGDREQYRAAGRETARYWRENYDGIFSRQKEKALAECNYNYLVYLAFYAELEAEYGNMEEAKRALLDLGGFRDTFIRLAGERFPEVVFPADNRDFPVLEPRFSLSHYILAYELLERAGVLTEPEMALIQEYAVSGANQAFTFPDWGTHNRAVMRAVNLTLAARAFPGHPNAGIWRQAARNIMRDNRGAWSIEDTPNYFPLWLHDMILYAELTGREDELDLTKMRYYLDMLVKLFNPLGYVCDFGDDVPGINMVQTAVLEWGAARFRVPEMRYVAQAMFRKFRLDGVQEEAALRGIGRLLNAARWTDESIAPRPPKRESGEVLDDLVGKKLLFQRPDGGRFLLLNYRDEGDYGYLTRSFLRGTLFVQPEKMHHGHADENTVASLIWDGKLLLGDGGYRETENPIGEYRADYYHNGVIIRRGVPEKGARALPYAIGRGAYEPVRSTKLYFYVFDRIEVSRTRVEKELCTWDRAVVWLKEEDAFVITDVIRVREAGDYTIFPLYYPEAEELRIAFAGGGMTETYGMRRRGEDQMGICWAVRGVQTPERPLVIHTLLSCREDLEMREEENVLVVKGNGVPHIMHRTDTELALDGVERRPAYSFGEQKAVYGAYETDGMFLYARPEGPRLWYTAVNATRVLYRGRRVFGGLPAADYNEFTRVQGWKIRQDTAKQGIDTYWNCWEDCVELEQNRKEGSI